MRILYLTDAQPDYLSDDLLYGLRSVLGSDVVDYPRKDVLYRTSPLKPEAHKLWGRGFHCFGLDDVPIDRSDIASKIGRRHFDFIINSSAWRIRCPVHPRLVVIDGEDHARLMPQYVGKGLYFKRELYAPQQPGVEPILFALPDFLNDERVLPRTKRHHASFLPTSKVREELAATYPPQYSFLTWGEYLTDIKQSWFGISPRGAGYDCQRHYEILGQAVLCIFMDEGAPSLLRGYFRDGHNCLTFSSAEELERKMNRCINPERLIEQARADLLSTHLASKRAEQLVALMMSKNLTSIGPGWLNRLEWRSWVRRATARHEHFGGTP